MIFGFFGIIIAHAVGNVCYVTPPEEGRPAITKAAARKSQKPPPANPKNTPIAKAAPRQPEDIPDRLRERLKQWLKVAA